MRFMSISFKIKLCGKKNFLLQNYLIYDLQAGTEVRQNWGQGTCDPFHCSEWLKWRVLRDDFRKVRGPNQFLGWSPGATFSFAFHRCQPACDRLPGAPAAAPACGAFKPFSETPSHKGVSGRALRNAFVSHICCVGGRDGQAPWKAPPAAPWPPWPCPGVGTAGPEGLSAKSATTRGSWSALKDATPPTEASPGFFFLFQKLGSSLIWGD